LPASRPDFFSPIEKKGVYDVSLERVRTDLQYQICIRGVAMSAAAICPWAPEAAPILFAKAPRPLDFHDGLSPMTERIWNRINATIDTERKGRISVSELARYGGCSGRTVYRHLRVLKEAGRLYSITPPGGTATYYLNVSYKGPRAVSPVTTPTPDSRVTPTPDTAVRGPIPMGNGIPHAPARTQETTGDNPRTTTPQPPQQAEADVVLSHEERTIADTLIENGVTAKVAEHIAKTIPVEDNRQAIAAADEYKQTHLHEIGSLSGLFVKACKNRWKPNKPIRPRPTPAELEPGICKDCGQFLDSDGVPIELGAIRHTSCFNRMRDDPPPHAVANI